MSNHMVPQVPVRRAPAATGKGKAAAAAAEAAKGGGKGPDAAPEAPAPKAVPKRKPAAKAAQEADGASADSPAVVPQVIIKALSYWLLQFILPCLPWGTCALPTWEGSAWYTCQPMLSNNHRWQKSHGPTPLD